MFGRGRSLKLVDIAGIRIGADPSWFFVLFLLIFILSSPFRDALHSSDGVAYLTTVATVLLFFVSLIVHELGHAFAARRHGIEVNRIDLFLLGGTTYMSRDAETPSEEFKVAIAGPIGTLLFIIVCLAVDVALVGPHRILQAVELDDTIRITPVLLSLSWLLPMNILILAFNLVPAYPLDGGRIARAAVWRYTGDKLRGTRASAQLGRGFAVLLGAFGLWSTTLGGGGFVGLWLILLAFMIWQSARYALQGTAVTQRVQGVRVLDIMDHEPVIVPSTTPLTQALDEFFLRYSAPWLPVVDPTGHFLGISRRYRVQELADADPNGTVQSVIETDETSNLRVQYDQPLTDVIALEALGRMGAVVAVDRDNVLRGVVTLEQARRALQTVLASPVRG